MVDQSSTCSEFAAFAHAIADAARAETLPRFRKAGAVSNKDAAGFDPVTDADREAERVLREHIGAAYPDHGVLGEEFGETAGDGPWRWVLDPVDGTRAFVCGVASWTTLIALERDERSVIGLIDQPFTDERWLGADGETHYFRNGMESVCRTSKATELALARVSTTDPRGSAIFSDDEARAFARVTDRAQVCRFGFDAYGYGLLAQGQLDLVIEAGLQRHDFAALIPVVEGAGGVISNWRGEAVGTDARGETIAAATPALHAAALTVLKG